MKTTYLSIALVMISLCLRAQGTFIYDQQSADESHYLEGGTGLGMQPLGQSFTPSLNAVGFIRIYVNGGVFGTFLMNLRSDSITGTILASTPPITLNGTGPADFVFPTPVSVTPGVAYYFQPVIQSGVGGWGTFLAAYNYAGGTAFVSGLAITDKDLWFREGIVVPEPCSAVLFLLGSGILFCTRRKLAR